MWFTASSGEGKSTPFFRQFLHPLFIGQTASQSKVLKKNYSHATFFSFITHRLILFKILETFNRAIDMNQSRHTVTNCEMRPIRGPEKLPHSAE